MDVLSILLVLAAFLLILYNASTTYQFYMRISFFYICILLHGIECNITMIPSYLRGAGADLIFKTFRYWCFWTGINVEVRDFDKYLAKMDGPAVVVVNHQSTIDVIAMNYVWPPRGVVMMKKSLMYIPFFNSTSVLANSIFVSRDSKSRANDVIEKCAQQLKDKNHKLWIFPEGTRNQNGSLLPFKKGAFNIAISAQIPVVPIVLSDYRQFYDGDKKYFKNDGEIIAQVLPPVSTEGLTLDNAAELAENVREQMLEVFKKISPEADARMIDKRTKKHA